MHTIKRFGFTAYVLFFLLCAGLHPAQAGPTINFGDNAFLGIDFASQLYLQTRDTGSGSDNDDRTSDIYFKRNRLMFRGMAGDKYGFYFALNHRSARKINDLFVSDKGDDELDVIDAFFIGDFTDAFRLRAGLTKDMLTRENNEGCFDPLSMDRSLFIYTPLPRLSRDYGVVAWGNFLDAKLQYRLAVMRGFHDGNDPDSSFRYTARLHVSLLEPEYSIIYLGTYLGKKKVLTFGAGYQIEPDAVYANVAAKTLPKDYKAWTVDGFFEYPTSAGTFTISGAYLKTDFDDAYLGGDPDSRSIDIYGERNGWYAKAGYLFPMKVGPGELQVYGRYEDWKYAQLLNIFDQDLKWYGGGINYFIKGQDLRVTLEYSHTDFDQEDDNSKDFNTLTAMLQFRF